MTVDISDDFIDILEDNGDPIVSWSKDEWMENPELVVPAIANAIVLALSNPELLREYLVQPK